MSDYIDSIEVGSGTEYIIRDPEAVHMSDLFNLIYPVGSIYMSVSPTDPGTIFGGTWVAWGQGRVPVGVGTSDRAFAAGETGGSSDAIVPTHTHSLSSHTHSLSSHTHSLSSHTHTLNNHYHSVPTHRHALAGDSAAAVSGGSHAHSVTGTASDAGGHTHGTGNSAKPNFLVYNGTLVNDDAAYASGDAVRFVGLNKSIWGSNDGWSYRAATSSAGVHSHSLSATAAANGAHSHTLTGYSGYSGVINSNTPSNNTSGTPSDNTSGTPSNNTSGTPSTDTTGGATNGVAVTGKNLQPYVTCYMWRRES